MEFTTKQKLDMVRSEILGYATKIEKHLPGNIELIKKNYGKAINSREDGRDILKKAIIKGEPFMAGRFGTSEGHCFFRYLEIQGGLRRNFKKINRHELTTCSGFFPDEIDKYSQWGGTAFLLLQC